jgi:D-serine deaminase-like pyridoxal phosphate-dependent protein
MLYDEIDTPAVLVDLDVVERNLQRFQAYCDEQGLKSRPHIKTHKNVGFAKRQLELGAVGHHFGFAELLAGDADCAQLELAFGETDVLVGLDVRA